MYFTQIKKKDEKLVRIKCVLQEELRGTKIMIQQIVSFIWILWNVYNE